MPASTKRTGTPNKEDQRIKKSKALFKVKMNKVTQRQIDEKFYSEPKKIQTLPWKVYVEPNIYGGEGSPKCLGFFLECNGDSLGRYWSCKAQAKLKVVNHKDPNKSLEREISHLFYWKRSQYGYKDFIQWTHMTNPERGFIQNDSITFECIISVEKPRKDPLVWAERIFELETIHWEMRESCQKCRSPENPNQILLCEKCENGWHTTCLIPPLNDIPEGIWLCPTCGHVASEQSEVSDCLKIKELEDKVKDANETLTNCRTKLDLQKEMSRMYEKQQQQMMDILQIPQEDRAFAKVLNAVKAFQEAKAGIFNNTQEQNEVDLYENAERILQD